MDTDITTVYFAHIILQQHRTALFWACMQGHAQVVGELLQAGADATITNKVF